MVILVAFTALCSFAIPSEEFAFSFRILKFAVIMMSAWLGYFGFLISLMVILLHLAKLKSCGYPYMMPFVGSELTGGEDEKDSIIRFPLRRLWRRPVFAKRKGVQKAEKEIRMTKNMSTSYTFAQNESISPRQLYRLYVFNLLGVGTLVLPNNLAKLGKYAFISIALGVFMAWLFMWIVSEVRERGKTIYDRSIDKTKYAKMLIYDLIIAIYELSQAAFLAWIFVKLIRDSLIPDESFTVVLLVIMAVCAYALSGGVECRARVYEVVFFFVLIPLAAMLLFAISDVRFDYLMIKDRVGVDFGIADIFAGAYYVFAASISVFNILFVRERTASQIRGSVSKAIFTYAGILFIVCSIAWKLWKIFTVGNRVSGCRTDE